jgi:hypothetical protein
MVTQRTLEELGVLMLQGFRGGGEAKLDDMLLVWLTLLISPCFYFETVS